MASGLSLGGYGVFNLPVACKASIGESPTRRDTGCSKLLRRDVLLATALIPAAPLLQSPAFALIEGDDDEELLEKVKGDRLKRIERRGALSALKDEAASLQAAVYKLSRAGQAIDNDDLATANTVLLDSDWVLKTKSALAKVSMSAEEQGQAERFTSSLSSLQSAVAKQDVNSAKSAFVTSATALEKWATLTGLTEQIKGL